MSRSRKKSPFVGYTTAKSDQPWKAKAARAFRHATEQALRGDPSDAALPVKRWARVNPWDAPVTATLDYVLPSLDSCHLPIQRRHTRRKVRHQNQVVMADYIRRVEHIVIDMLENHLSKMLHKRGIITFTATLVNVRVA